MKAQVVSFHCVLRDKIGKIISSTFNQDVITDGGRSDEILKGLAAGLKNLSKGEKRRIFVPADQAYGFYDPALLIELPRSQFSKGKTVQVGQEVSVNDDDGLRDFRVIAINPSTVTLDGNHPLAGQDLQFDIEAVEARDANSEDLAELQMKSPSRFIH